MRVLAHLSDIHFGALDGDIADALIPYLRKLKADVMVMSGDFSQRARAKQFLAAREFLAYFDVPQLYVPGNHDIPMFAFWERIFCPLRKYKKYITRELSPVYEDEELLVIGVNTARPFVPKLDGFWKDGRISLKQLTHIVNRSEASREKTCVVVTHHPFIAPPGARPHGTVLHGPEILPTLANAAVDVVLAGHLHASYHDEIRVTLPGGKEGGKGERSILSVQAGTATSYRRRQDPQGREYPNAFNILRLSPGRIGLETHGFTEANGGGNGGVWGLIQSIAYTRTKGRLVPESSSPALRDRESR